jgi:hypothetical protein
MKRSKMILMFVAAFILAAFSVAQADTILLVTSPQPGASTVDWSQLGAAGQVLPHSFLAIGNDPNSDSVTGKFAAPNTNKGTLAVQGTNWGGDFNTGDYLVWAGHLTNGNPVGVGPLSLTFALGGYNFAGAYFQQDFFGAFTAKLEFFDGTNSLGFVTESGVSSGTPGTAMFIGGFDLTGSNITRVVFSETAGSHTTDFAIGTLYYGVVPEPGTMVLLGSGLIGLAGFARRRMSK